MQTILSFFIIYYYFWFSSINGDRSQDLQLNKEYANYMKQVSDVLESDPEFSKKLKALPTDADLITVADHLNLVSNNVRTKLDELKRIEIDRINKLESKLERLKKVSSKSVNPADKQHIDTTNDKTFEMEDLRKLIKKAVEDANKADEMAEEEYRRYKMEKEVLRRARLAKIKSKEKREKERLIEEERKRRHRNHTSLNHPGSEEQFKEIWEQEDKLERDNFDAVTFFKLHDINGDGHLDVNEVEALLQKELSKAYEKNNTDDDLMDMEMELRRMRKEVYREMDKNKDMMISFAEYMKYVKTPEFRKNDDWKPLDETNKTAFNDEDIMKFTEQYAKKHDINIKPVLFIPYKKWKKLPKKNEEPLHGYSNHLLFLKLPKICVTLSY